MPTKLQYAPLDFQTFLRPCNLFVIFLFLDYRRYQQEHKLPLRFKTASAASENALYHPREPPSVDPTLRTRYHSYVT